MSVELIQKNKNIRVNIVVDGTDLLQDHSNAIASIEAQRAAGLADRIDAEGNSTPLTPQQAAVVNAAHDMMIESKKRELTLKIMDAASREISEASNVAAFSESDFAAMKAARKSKIDAEFDAAAQKRPSLDIDAIK